MVIPIDRGESQGLHLLGSLLLGQADSQPLWSTFGTFTGSLLHRHGNVRTEPAKSIEDYEISSHVPTCCPLGGSVHLGYFTAMVKLSQLLSLVNKKLSQVRSTGSAAEGLVKVIQDLDHSLEELQQSLVDVLGVKLPLDLSNIPANLNNHQALSIQSLYYNVVWDIHTPLTYPWLRGAFALDQDAPTRAQIQASSSTVATSSRAAVLGTRHIYLDPNCCQL